METVKDNADCPPPGPVEAKGEKKALKKAEKSCSAKKVKKEVQDKIMACFGEGLDLDILEVSKKDIAERLNTQPGSHGFFYAWQDLQKNKGYIQKLGRGGKFSLTKVGKQNLPKGVVLGIAKIKTNDDKIDTLKKSLLKQCKEAVAAKVDIIFDILKDGKPHTLDEFTQATGYANLKSKGLGYPISFMTKDMKILEKVEKDTWQFTDKCFPQGRPQEGIDGDADESMTPEDAGTPENPQSLKPTKEAPPMYDEQPDSSQLNV